MQSRNYFGLIAGFLGFMGVAIGAAAAHKARDPRVASLLNEASLYTLIHCPLLYAVSQRRDKVSCLSSFLLVMGILLFCGGIVIKAIAEIHFTIWLIPFGGGCLMGGWITAGLGCVNKEDKPADKAKPAVAAK